MGIMLVIISFFAGFFGLILDVNLNPDGVFLFSIVFFLLPSVYTIGKIYENLANSKSNHNNICDSQEKS